VRFAPGRLQPAARFGHGPDSASLGVRRPPRFLDVRTDRRSRNLGSWPGRFANIQLSRLVDYAGADESRDSASRALQSALLRPQPSCRLRNQPRCHSARCRTAFDSWCAKRRCCRSWSIIRNRKSSWRNGSSTSFNHRMCSDGCSPGWLTNKRAAHAVSGLAPIAYCVRGS